MTADIYQETLLGTARRLASAANKQTIRQAGRNEGATENTLQRSVVWRNLTNKREQTSCKLSFGQNVNRNWWFSESMNKSVQFPAENFLPLLFEQI